MLKCQFRIAAHWLTGCRHSLWWGRSGLSWTASEPWSRRKSQRTRWRTSGWCQARSRRSLRPAPLRTSSTASWSGLPRWHSLAAETRTKKKKRRSLKPTICGEKQLHELSDLQFLTSKKKKDTTYQISTVCPGGEIKEFWRVPWWRETKWYLITDMWITRSITYSALDLCRRRHCPRQSCQVTRDTENW